MKVKELIEALSSMDPEIEVVLFKQGAYDCPSFSTTRIKIVEGYLVRDEEDTVSFYTKARGNGMFVDKQYASTVCEDGKTFLDLTSITIHPAVQLDLPKW